MLVRPRADALLAPVRGVLDEALARLGVPAPATIDVGDVPGFGLGRDGEVLLSDGLLGPALRHPEEDPGPLGLDRWRRAVATVLEQAVLATPPDRGPAWLRAGLAIARADRAAPELRLALPDLAAAADGELGRRPRGGVAVLRAWTAAGVDAEARAAEVLAGGRIEVAWMVDAARWILGPGLAADVPEVVRPPAVDVPTSLGPWALARLAVPAHPRGGHVVVRGRGGVAPAWAPADRPLEAFAAACEEGCELLPDVGGPVGTWELRSAEGFGQVFGARGVQFAFRPSGRLDVVLADAFIGSLRDLPTAERMGTSGTAHGRWRVAGPRALALVDLVPAGLTVHGRDDAPFVLPAQGFGVGEQLRAMEQGTWRWEHDDDGVLVLRGEVFGGRVAMRFAPVP